ncbi:hypothetical protein Droror1_Dr00014888 [Drosera rotundifolia]
MVCKCESNSVKDSILEVGFQGKGGNSIGSVFDEGISRVLMLLEAMRKPVIVILLMGLLVICRRNCCLAASGGRMGGTAEARFLQVRLRDLHHRLHHGWGHRQIRGRDHRQIHGRDHRRILQRRRGIMPPIRVIPPRLMNPRPMIPEP